MGEIYFSKGVSFFFVYFENWSNYSWKSGRLMATEYAKEEETAYMIYTEMGLISNIRSNNDSKQLGEMINIIVSIDCLMFINLIQTELRRNK